jgi:malonyl-CoA decarboxylase
VVIAREILNRYRALSTDDRRAFLRFLAESLTPEAETINKAARAYLDAPDAHSLAELQRAVESPRQEFFRRLNLAPGATAEIVAMRRDVLRAPKSDTALVAVDADLMHLFYSWFNRGFLVLRRIDWQTPAAILEKIIAYEAVHEIQGWDDLRRRLDPHDRRCFAFFHPSLVDEPLIFVEVALTHETPDSIQTVLKQEPTRGPIEGPTTAVFYSISNCQEGLRGISFGNFLIKQVVEDLVKEIPSLTTFVTLSPVPHFARWLDRLMADDSDGMLAAEDREALRALRNPGWLDGPDEGAALKDVLLALGADYFLRAKTADDMPVDPVARFHLGNGARLDRINWLGDVSEKGLRESHGLMVNYRYDLKEIERNHEAFENDGTIAASRAIKGLLRPLPKAKTEGPPRRLALPGR